MRGWYFRDWERGGSYRVALKSGLSGTFYPGEGFAISDAGIHADAPAVVDDFGSLVIVGGWS